MFDNVITLVKETESINEFGDIIVEETTRDIFAELKSIGQTEFYQAQAVGLKPEIKFVIADFLDYKGEKKLKYTPFGEDEEKEYTVLRTYRANNMLEIVCKRGID